MRISLYPTVVAVLGLLPPCAVAAPADPPALLLQAEGQLLHAVCSGGGAQIEGNHNVIVLAGPCLGLRLNGVANQVTIDLTEGAAVRIEGSANRVIYRAKTGPAPNVVALGQGNAVSADVLPPPIAVSMETPPSQLPATGALTLAGNDEHRLADCTGRDIVVQGMRSAYVLRGGCRSITVTGDLDTVQAEIAPGARIAIEGAGTLVAWALVGPGEGPMERVHGRFSQVRRTDRIGGRPGH